MGRHRTPLAKARLTGADRKHPDRYRDRSEPKLSGEGLGDPPAYLGPTAKRAWRLLAAELPWLVREDRGLVEVVSLMRSYIIDGKTADMPSSFFGNYRMALASLGATPVDRAKVPQSGEPDDEDPFAAFGPPQ